MWDEDDTSGRWVQGLCAIPLIAWMCIDFYLYTMGYWTSYSSYGRTAWCGSGIGSAYVAYRCLRYALTGRGNINRDDY
jgi:hypothetical protein